MKQLLRVFPVALVITLLVPAMTPTIASAQTVDGQREKVADIVDQLDRLEEKSNQLAEDYVEAVDTKSQLDAEIVDAEAQIATKEAELDQLRGSLSEMALRSYVGGGAAPLGPLFEDAEQPERRAPARRARPGGTERRGCHERRARRPRLRSRRRP